MPERDATNSVAGALASLQPAARDLVRFDRSRITYLTALQNAFGVFLPLALGAATGHLLAGLAAGIGALQVAFSDRPGPYRLRAGRMVLVALLAGLSALVGGVTGHLDVLFIVLVAGWTIAGGMMVVFGPAAEQIGLTAILLLIIYGGFGISPGDAIGQAALVVSGGVLQTVLSVIAWPFRPFAPERKALASVFRSLAASSRAPLDSEAAPPVTSEMTSARETLTGLGRTPGRAAEALRVLLDEAERIRLELIALQHLRDDLRDNTPRAAPLDDLSKTAATLLDRLADAVADGAAVDGGARLLEKTHQAVEALRSIAARSDRANSIPAAVLWHAEALLGQLRACIEITDSGSAEGEEERISTEAGRSTVLRLGEPLATLRANFTLRSASFRHALRLAATLVIAVVLCRHLGASRSYWVPLTVAIVLKPDFTSTFTRGLLRVIGTMLGLGLATLLVHLVAGDVAARVVLIGLLVFVIRSVGPANFGLSGIAVTALVVFLISFIGASPESIIHLRAVDTVIGGALALAAYALWPSWERNRAPSLVSDLLDIYRRYFSLVMSAYLDPSSLDREALDRTRLEGRLARSNAEASVARMRSEPAPSTTEADLSDGLLASSHRFINSVMAFEAVLYALSNRVAPPGLERFVRDVDVTLEWLSTSLRPGAISRDDNLPDLRADQTALQSSAEGSEPLLLETERITNSANTMVDLVRRSVPESRGQPDGHGDPIGLRHPA